MLKFILLLLLTLELCAMTDLNSFINSQLKVEKQLNSPDINATKKNKLKKPKQNLSRDTYKDGDEYVKEGNHIHKRTWEDGTLIDDITLEETIQESRDKHKEDIPQISTPEKGEKR